MLLQSGSPQQQTLFSSPIRMQETALQTGKWRHKGSNMLMSRATQTRGGHLGDSMDWTRWRRGYGEQSRRYCLPSNLYCPIETEGRDILGQEVGSFLKDTGTGDCHSRNESSSRTLIERTNRIQTGTIQEGQFPRPSQLQHQNVHSQDR